jgi:translation elongation factor EF-Ts
MEEKITLDKDKLFVAVKKIGEVHDYPVETMAEGEKIPIMKVKKASLDDQIRAEAISSIPIIMLKKLLEQVEKGEEIKPDIIKGVLNHPGTHPKTSFEIHLFQRCVVEPKFTIEEALKLSETMPELVNEVCAFALGLRPEKENGG